MTIRDTNGNILKHLGVLHLLRVVITLIQSFSALLYQSPQCQYLPASEFRWPVATLKNQWPTLKVWENHRACKGPKTTYNKVQDWADIKFIAQSVRELASIFLLIFETRICRTSSSLGFLACSGILACVFVVLKNGEHSISGPRDFMIRKTGAPLVVLDIAF